MINATLCIPKLVARLAVSEASLQRLHGSPGEAQTEAAQLGSWAIPRPAQAGLPSAIESGQRSPASDSPGKQRHAVLCRCARPCDWEQCRIEQILGLSCPAVSTLAGWTNCFELLDAMLARITGPPTSEGESCAQRCASMAESLRGTLKGLPVSTLGAATTCLVAKVSTVLANRTVYQDVSLQPPCPLQCLLSLASTKRDTEHYMLTSTHVNGHLLFTVRMLGCLSAHIHALLRSTIPDMCASFHRSERQF